MKARNMTTYCAGQAQSAATLILMSGVKRYVTPDARIGFHAGTFPGSTKEMSEAMDSEIESLMRKGGVSDSFIKRVLATPHNRMWYPSFNEMLQAHFITAQSFGEGFASPWGLPDVDLEKIFEKVETKRNVKAFKTCLPDDYDKMKTDVINALRSGRSEVEAISIVNETTRRVFLSSLSFASDEAINALSTETLRFLKEHVHTNPKGCIYFLKGTNVNLARVFPEALLDEGLQIAAANVIISGNQKDLKEIDVKRAEDQNEAIWNQIYEKYGNKAAIISDQEKWDDNADSVSFIFIELYSIIVSMSYKDSANYMRWLLCQN